MILEHGDAEGIYILIFFAFLIFLRWLFSDRD